MGVTVGTKPNGMRARTREPPPRYARVYADAYLAYRRKDMAGWIRRTIRRSRAVATRIAWSTHMLTVARTQSIAAPLPPPTLRLLQEERRLAQLCWIITRLRPLQRRILDFLWRPGGAMARREAAAAQATLAAA